MFWLIISLYLVAVNGFHQLPNPLYWGMFNLNSGDVVPAGQLIDLNGDALPDFVCWSKDYGNGVDICNGIWINDGKQFVPQNKNVTLEKYENPSKRIILRRSQERTGGMVVSFPSDFESLKEKASAAFQIPSSQIQKFLLFESKAQIMDIKNLKDGDIVVIETSTNLKGSFNIPANLWNWQSLGNSDFGMADYGRFVDIDGDGLLDIVLIITSVQPACSFRTVYLNNGSDWTLTSCWAYRPSTLCPACPSAGSSIDSLTLPELKSPSELVLQRLKQLEKEKIITFEEYLKMVDLIVESDEGMVTLHQLFSDDEEFALHAKFRLSKRF